MCTLNLLVSYQLFGLLFNGYCYENVSQSKNLNFLDTLNNYVDEIFTLATAGTYFSKELIVVQI